MSITFPLALPTAAGGPASTSPSLNPQVGATRSPFTGGMQTYAWPNEYWTFPFNLPAMIRADAEEWIGFLLALNGMEGSFLAGQPGYTTPRGTWSGGSPLVNGAGQSGKVLLVDGLSAGATGKRGDYFQLGSGATSRLYKLTKDMAANGSGQATLDFQPRLRATPADNDPLVLASPVGLMMRTENATSWSIELAMLYGLTFNAMEDLRDL